MSPQVSPNKNLKVIEMNLSLTCGGKGLEVWVSAMSSQFSSQSIETNLPAIMTKQVRFPSPLLWQNVNCRLFLICRDPEVFHHLPAPALRGRVRSLPSEGRQLIEVTRALIPPRVRGRDPEHGPEKRSSQKWVSCNAYQQKHIETSHLLTVGWKPHISNSRGIFYLLDP